MAHLSSEEIALEIFKIKVDKMDVNLIEAKQIEDVYLEILKKVNEFQKNN